MSLYLAHSNDNPIEKTETEREINNLIDLLNRLNSDLIALFESKEIIGNTYPDLNEGLSEVTLSIDEELDEINSLFSNAPLLSRGENGKILNKNDFIIFVRSNKKSLKNLISLLNLLNKRGIIIEETENTLLLVNTILLLEQEN